VVTPPGHEQLRPVGRHVDGVDVGHGDLLARLHLPGRPHLQHHVRGHAPHGARLARVVQSEVQRIQYPG
jgi:hypothetical protein